VSTGLRRIFTAGAVLLIIGSVLALRLNSDKISQHFYQQMQGATAAHLSADHVELTFMHGIGLRLDGVVIKHAQYQVRAKHMNISLRLLPLLLGKIQADALDIHDADIIIQPVSLAPTSTTISSLPVPSIRFVRSRIQTTDGKTILDNMYLDMRNIGPDSKTSWELKAKQDKQVLSGTGRLLFHAGQIEKGFSKLKMEHFELTRLQPFAPHAFMTWLQGEGSLLSGAVTLDISKHHNWALFGEVELEREHHTTSKAHPHQADTVLKLRGKLSHPTDGALVWRDSFIHIGKQTMVSIDGQCQQSDCNTTLDAKQVPLSEWGPFMPDGISFYDHLSGMTDLNASIQWNHEQWHGDVSLQLTKAHFNRGEHSIALPRLHLQANNLGGNASQWHTEATITSPDAEGSIQLRNEQHSNGNKDLYIDSHDAASQLWQPLTNMLLATLNIEPALQAVGKIKGELHLHQQADKQSLFVDVNATQTQLAYASWLNKPEHIVAQCKARLDLSKAHIVAVSVQQCRLDSSSINALNWSRHKKNRQLSLNKLDLHIEQFRDMLPEKLQGLTGRLEGSATTVWTGTKSWLSNMNGEWKLDDIAMDSWHANGSVQVKNGIFSSHPLRINGIYGQAQLSGFFEPARLRGDIDIISGQLDWNNNRALNDVWQPLTIKGHIYQAQLNLLNNNWQNIQSNYILTNGKLRLNELQARLADGQFSSQQLTLTPQPDGIDVQGDIRSNNILLQKLPRLHRWLGASISGKLQANVKLHGRIGADKLSDWLYSNGDILIYDGGWKQQQKREAMTAKPGVLMPLLQPVAFSKLGFRFHIGKDQVTLPHITLIHKNGAYQGSAAITPDLHLTGIMHNAADQTDYRIESILPDINWLLQ